MTKSPEIRHNSGMSNTNKVTFEATPNPATMKFKFHRELLNMSMDFPTAQEAERSPLAAKIFGFPWTSGVFLGPDFVAVTKQDWVDWEVLAEPLAGLINEHLDRGEALYVEWAEDNSEDDENDSDVVKQIKQILKRDIRPVVALDGGDIAFVKYENNILSLQMKGACSGCPSSQATLKDGIEVRIKELIPEVKEVVSI